MADCEQKVQESSSWGQSTRLDVSGGLECICWNPKEVDPNASEGMDLQGKGKPAKNKSFLLPRPYVGFQQKFWLRLDLH